MTVMFKGFFGVPQFVIRSGLWARMKPSEQSLYIALCHDSERYCTRELRRSDAEMLKLTGLSSRTLCNARKRLPELGLAHYHLQPGGKHVYTLLNPQTGVPWPGAPDSSPFRAKKKSGPVSSPTQPESRDNETAEANSAQSTEPNGPWARKSQPNHANQDRPAEDYGEPGIFGKKK